MLTHWLSLMHSDGWIPREQILGAEARARVPSEFRLQHRHHANPPTLLLRMQRQLDTYERARGAPGVAVGGDEAEWLSLVRKLWPRLLRWYKWYARTQAGDVPGAFRWRGRDPDDGKLNAMTLSSGHQSGLARASLDGGRACTALGCTALGCTAVGCTASGCIA